MKRFKAWLIPDEEHEREAALRRAEALADCFAHLHKLLQRIDEELAQRTDSPA